MFDAVRHIRRIDIECYARRLRDCKRSQRQHHETQNNQGRFAPVCRLAIGAENSREGRAEVFVTDHGNDSRFVVRLYS